MQSRQDESKLSEFLLKISNRAILFRNEISNKFDLSTIIEQQQQQQQGGKKTLSRQFLEKGCHLHIVASSLIKFTDVSILLPKKQYCEEINFKVINFIPSTSGTK